MPKGPHRYTEGYFYTLLSDLVDANVLTREESRPSHQAAGGVVLPSRTWNRPYRENELGPASIKVADTTFERLAGSPYPSVVVECGFSQEYDDPVNGGLLQDAMHSLEQTKRGVKCVVLVCINESKLVHRNLPEEEEEEEEEDSDSDDSTTEAYNAQYEQFSLSVECCGD